ncbi:hypothetical protein ABN253_11580 [Proteus genomosp. 6]|uniref:Uncharacterized protein n=1 Tax=Proteus genomosp. 6 TaxID=1311820 RepID=A0ABV1LAW2_9GAMM
MDKFNLLEIRRKHFINSVLIYIKQNGKKTEFKSKVNNKTIITGINFETLNNFFRDVYEEKDCRQRCKWSDKDIYNTYEQLYKSNGSISEIGKFMIDYIVEYLPTYLNGEEYKYHDVF